MILNSMYVFNDGKILRKGFTTGTTSTAALKAFLEYSLNGLEYNSVEIKLPRGEKLSIPVEKYSIIKGKKYAFVRKDAGDDADITNGCLISVTCDFEEKGGITFDSEFGVGRVTKEGLGIEIGQPAINEIPRKMMRELLQEYGVDSARVIINVEDGERLAKSTLNGRLGIMDGISIIGTTGIVQPMSEQSWKESLLPQMDVIRSGGFDEIILIPGGVGEKNFVSHFGAKENMVMCGNHFGFSVKKAVEKGFKTVWISGAFQKIIKLAGGNWNTDSRYSDSKAEILALHTIMCEKKYDEEMTRSIMECNPFSGVIRILEENNCETGIIFAEIAKSAAKKLRLLTAESDCRTEFRITIFCKDGILSDYSTEAEKKYEKGEKNK